eukprot:13205203-Alexandrium_andersonii.AAC.1
MMPGSPSRRQVLEQKSAPARTRVCVCAAGHGCTHESELSERRTRTRVGRRAMGRLGKGNRADNEG